MHLHASSDESPDLPRWATITQVSSALLVPRTTVRGAVRRALAEGELWVRRADADDEHSPYLIDTTHPTYLAHVQRWQENQTMTEEAEEDVRGRLDLDPFPSVQHALQRYAKVLTDERKWKKDAGSAESCGCSRGNPYHKGSLVGEM